MPSHSLSLSLSLVKLRIRYPGDRTSILKFPLDPQRDWGIGRVGGGEEKNTRRESAVGALLSACPADVGQGRNEFQTPFRTFLASISRSCPFLYTHPRCTWGHPLQSSARQTTPTVTRITDSLPLKKKKRKHPLSAKMDYVSFVEIFLHSFETGFASKKIPATPFIIFLTIEFFRK